MAEKVNLREEDWIPLFCLIREHKILTRQEFIDMQRVSKSHEYKLQSANRTVGDYRDYMEFCLQTLTSLKDKAQEFGLSDVIDPEIERTIHELISSRLGVAKQTFYLSPDFYTLCIKTFSFLGWKSRIVKILEDYCSNLGPASVKPFVIASHFCLRSSGHTGITGARNFYTSCIRRHPNSQLPYLLAVEIELMYISLLLGEYEKDDKFNFGGSYDDIIVDLKIVKEYYMAGASLFSSLAEYYIGMHDLVSKFKFTHSANLPKNILSDMERNAFVTEVTYDFYGRQTFGTDYFDFENVRVHMTYYEQGLAERGTHKMYEMTIERVENLRKFYIDAVSENDVENNGNIGKILDLICGKLNEYYTQAASFNYLSLPTCLNWIKFVAETNEGDENISSLLSVPISASLANYPTSWELLAQDFKNRLCSQFSKSIKKVPNNSQNSGNNPKNSGKNGPKDEESLILWTGDETVSMSYLTQLVQILKNDRNEGSIYLWLSVLKYMSLKLSFSHGEFLEFLGELCKWQPHHRDKFHLVGLHYFYKFRVTDLGEELVKGISRPKNLDERPSEAALLLITTYEFASLVRDPTDKKKIKKLERIDRIFQKATALYPQRLGPWIGYLSFQLLVNGDDFSAFNEIKDHAVKCLNGEPFLQNELIKKTEDMRLSIGCKKL